MIHIPIGTKAQLIKMAPIIREACNQNLEHSFILTGQHQETIDDLISTFELSPPTFNLVEPNEADSYVKLLKWLLLVFFSGLLKIKRYSKNDLMLVHGDTLSTLVMAFIGKIKGIKIVHIEAGLRSNNIFNPFPEELTRRLVTMLSDYFIVQNSIAESNLSHTDRIINTQYNSILDSLNFAKQRINIDIGCDATYAIASIHRYENLCIENNFNFIMTSILEASKIMTIIFVLHPVTRKKLQNSKWKDQLLKQNISLIERTDYISFTKLLLNSEFLITDGGSNQEEGFYIGLPCLIMRRHTERSEGIGENALLAKFNEKNVSFFLNNYSSFKKLTNTPDISVSKKIIDYVKQI
jgi:UDP-N-acetylglucosamine 2-epimerase (non-hydrolysing)